ncbi:fatty acid desaturase [Desertihabitans brevis]|uniref:fatty acid desaturase n=1 Tax=Desertihabitans brevis TaxID=2268447 RepID=UPI001F3AFBDF|nr:fatty acid desaturase [Desertihabitans brevis]
MPTTTGGLNHQIEHHLFPSMVRPSLRKVQTMLAEHCAAVSVPCSQTPLIEAHRVGQSRRRHERRSQTL